MGSYGQDDGWVMSSWSPYIPQRILVMGGNIYTIYFPFGGTRNQTQGLFHANQLLAYSLLLFFSTFTAIGLLLLLFLV